MVSKSLWTLVALLSASCTGARRAEPLVTVRDSAGVRIVEYEADPASAGSVSLEPVYVHGLDTGDYQFQSVVAGQLRRDGRAVVADIGRVEVVQIAPDAPPEILVRQGQGPAEVRRVLSVVSVGDDSVWVEDDGNARLMLLVRGEPTTSLSTQGDYSLTQGLGVRGVDPAGALLMTTTAYRTDFEEPWLPGYMVRFDPTTRQADTVASYDMAKRRSAGRINPFLPSGMTTVAGGGFVSARRDRPELIWRDSMGRVHQIARWSPNLSFPTDVDWETFAASLRSDMRRMNPMIGNADLDRVLADYEVRPEEALPLFGQIRGERLGGVWIEPFVPSSSPRPQRYSIISADGLWLGTVVFPSPTRILDVSGEYVLGVVTDELEVEAVAVFRVARVREDP